MTSLSDTMILRHRGKRGIRFVRTTADPLANPSVSENGDALAAAASGAVGGDGTWTPRSETALTPPAVLLDEAYQRGIADGRRAVEEELVRMQLTEEQTRNRRVEALGHSFRIQLDGLLGRIETDALRFALAVAERIVKREVRIDKEVVVRQIREAVKRVVGIDSIKIRVNPEEESVARQHRSAILGSLREVLIEADATIERGGCIIESTAGNVDARLETQLRQVEAALFGAAAQEGRKKR
jgi:flagellar biosynthesis/type III secretory pathway protein FliH